MKDLWLSANTDKLQADKKHIHFFLLALWPLGKIWIQHHQSREQNLLITDCDNIRQSNISASALFLYGCWGWCVRLHLPLAHLEPNDLLNLSQQWHLCRTTEKFLWMPSLLKAEKQVTKSQQNNCTEFLLDLASVNLLTKLTSNSYCWDIWDKGGKKKKKTFRFNSNVCRQCRHSQLQLGDPLLDSQLLFLHPKRKAPHSWQATEHFEQFLPFCKSESWKKNLNPTSFSLICKNPLSH